MSNLRSLSLQPTPANVLRHDDSALIPAAAFGRERTAAWRRLVREESEPNVFAEPWALLPAIDALGALDEVSLAWISDSTGELLGVLPLCRARRYGRLTVDHTANWRHANAFCGTPTVRAGRESAFWHRLLRLLDDSPDWPAFLHLSDLVEHGPVLAGLTAAAAALERPVAVVHRFERALLTSPLSPDDYWAAHVRKKKRKELARLEARLSEQGSLTVERLMPSEPAAPWIDGFRALERAGWKGRAGSAVACSPATDAIFRTVIGGAHARRRLHALSLTLDGRPIAMLATLLAAPGAYSYKIAYDEAFARFSPGVLLERHALSLLEEPGVEWVDSCAVPDHPMIDHLWAERRSVVRVTVPLNGGLRRVTHDVTRLMERGWTAARRSLGALA